MSAAICTRPPLDRMRGAVPARCLLWIAALALVPGCGKKASPPLAPPPPPMIEAVYPAARSSGVPDTVEIWAGFAEPLDPQSVNSRNVVLYLDTQVIPATVSWDAAARRVVVHPRAPLTLGRTHTVELEPQLASADGTPLGRTYFWQFKTASVRTPSAPFPPDGAVDESRFVTLMWDPVEATAPTVYDVFVGADSAVIASRVGQPTVTTFRPWLMPGTRWEPASAYFWSVTVRCPSSGETSVGPVWRFDTVPANAPTRTTRLDLSDWTSYLPTNDSTACWAETFPIGGFWTTAIRWQLSSFGPRRLAGATIRLRYSSFYRPISVLTSRSPWNACDLRGFEIGELLASSTMVADDPGLMVLSSDLLTAHVEAALRHPGFHGYAFVGQSQIQIRRLGSSLELNDYVP